MRFQCISLFHLFETRVDFTSENPFPMISLAETPVESEELAALRTQVAKLEQEKLELEMFAWNTAQYAAAFADRNRWLTGADLQAAKDRGELKGDVVVNNDTAWKHFEENGTQVAFNKEFKNPDGSRNVLKLCRKFAGFIKSQAI